MSFVDEMNALRSAEVITEEFVMNEARKIVSAAVDAHLKEIQNLIKKQAEKQPLEYAICGTFYQSCCENDKFGVYTYHKNRYNINYCIDSFFYANVDLPDNGKGYQVEKIKSGEIVLEQVSKYPNNYCLWMKIGLGSIIKKEKRALFGRKKIKINGRNDLAKQFYYELIEKAYDNNITLVTAYDRFLRIPKEIKKNQKKVLKRWEKEKEKIGDKYYSGNGYKNDYYRKQWMRYIFYVNP